MADTEIADTHVPAIAAQADTPRPRRRRLARWLGLAAAGAIGVVAIVIAVRWLAFSSPKTLEVGNLSLEEQWDADIDRLGIKPLYPPEEDIAVGDLFAVVISDDPRFAGGVGPADTGGTGATRLTRDTPFIRRAVKVGHVDLTEQLKQAYDQLPMFPKDNDPAATKPAPPLFDPKGHAPRTDLPVAAFPALTLSNAGSASAGVSWLPAWLDFAATNATSLKLSLGRVETYGIDADTADAALTDYCAHPEHLVCGEDVVRKHLRPLVGDRVLQKVYDVNGSNYVYVMTVGLVMIYRVYLTHSIQDDRSASRAQGGGAGSQSRGSQSPGAQTSGAQSSGAPASSPPAASPPASAPTTPASGVDQQLAHIDQERPQNGSGGAGEYRASAASDIALNDTFPRALAFGYRSVPYEFDAARRIRQPVPSSK